MKLTEKSRFAIVAVASAVAGAAITTLVDRFALHQDLEFLGIVHNDVQKEVDDFKKKVEGTDNGTDDES